jgi:hypothetical protein
VAKSYAPKADDLLLFSEHLCYEVEMTYALAGWHLAPDSENVLLRNAMLEAFTIHLRQLIDFLWPQGDRRVGDTPDALAADYFETAERGASRRTSCGTSLGSPTRSPRPCSRSQKTSRRASSNPSTSTG